MSAQLTKQFLELKKKYLNGTATPAEIQLLEQYYDLFAGEPDVIDQLTESEIALLENNIKEGITNKINNREKPITPLYVRNLMRAAAVLVFISAGIYFIRSYTKNVQQVAGNKVYKNDIAPGGNKATLTLASGAKIVLEDARNGALSKQGNTVITKSGSQLAYNTAINAVKGTANAATTTTVDYNTITTPKGGQYNLVLADGTKVKLNAASSLKYPTAFAGKERNVELTGEAYFEVVKNKAMPFKVKTANQTVEVLGTHFNINAYADEAAIKTTLFEGSVKVSSGTNMMVIKPGQQAVADSENSLQLADNVDTDEVLAWKNEMFQFNEADIKTIMRQIARWYDVDIEFKGKLPPDLYRGKISRNVNVSEVLKILQLSGVNFTIEGRKIIVTS